MAYPELFILSALRALVEVSMLFLIAQGVLALLIGRRRHANAIYQLCLVVTKPVLKAVRTISPPQIIEKHHPFVAFFLLFWLWICLAYMKNLYCESSLLQCF